MSFPDELSAPEPAMPLCPVCGKPMQLEDVRRKAAEMGYIIPGDDEQYVIHCCGYTLRICDDEKYLEAIRLLKQYHGLA
jgi:hypothetical protein